MTSESGGKGQDFLKYWKPLAVSVFEKAEPVTVTTR